MINNVNEFILEMKDGEGPLDYMINDTSFARYVDETLINIKAASALLNEDLEALKHNILLRGYFKKLEKQQLKEEKSRQ